MPLKKETHFFVSMELPLHITPKAWQKIKAICLEKKIPAQYALRLSMRGSGCSGDFFLGFDVPKATDILFELPEGNIIIDKSKLLYFYMMQLDWIENEQGGGLKFDRQVSTH